MFKRSVCVVMLSVAMLCGVGNIMEVSAGDYAVGTVYNYNYFTAQTKWGVRGYFIIDPYGLPTPSNVDRYHTTTNHSKYGSETMIYYKNNAIQLYGHRWVPSGHNYRNNLTGDTTGNQAWVNFGYIGDANGTFSSTFLNNYIVTLTLEGVQYKAIYLEDVSTYSNGTWREIVRIRKNDNVTYVVLDDFSWDGTVSENFASLGNGVWAGAIEVNENGIFTNCSGKFWGNYQMDYINSALVWTPFGPPQCYLRVDDSLPWPSFMGYGSNYYGDYSDSGLRVTRPASPSPGYWLATKP